MIKHNQRQKNVLFLMLAFVVLYSVIQSSDIVMAGSINGSEAEVISAARGPFEYQGKTYVPKQEHIQQLITKFNQDDIDLTSEQATEAINNIYENIETGINEGYLVPLDSDKDKQPDDSKNQPSPRIQDEKPSSSPGSNETSKDDDNIESKEKSSYEVPSVIKETGFSYFNIFTMGVLGVLVITFFISIAMSIKICRAHECDGQTAKEAADE